ncbi:MAG TPA: hypothetical protein DCX06_06705 [Opitutae bacterium]|nr:hypothetical protein [Opitutae bacterium]
MQIDPIARSVKLSVRELAAFRNKPASEGIGYSQWRAAVGQEWHKLSEQQTRQQQPDAQFEVSISAQWSHKQWAYEINGRIDQVVPRLNGNCLREIKTVRTSLPIDIDELLARYPEYFAQTATYLALAAGLPEFSKTELTAELVFIDIENGAIQVVPISDEFAELFTHQLNALLPFLEDRRQCRIRLNEATVRPAFLELREGQAELFRALDKASLQSKTVLLEAPTGFGKTGIVLEHALKQMKNGLFERCIYLTSKSTGQLETIRQLQSMIGEDIRYIQMRNRKEHSIESGLHTCSEDRQCDVESEHYWHQIEPFPPDFFEGATLSLDRAKSLGESIGICPYSLTKSCLPYAELWIGDSNYIFAPSSQNVFLEQFGFDANKTLLIIDEAHNLPSRVADSLSIELNTGELIFALEEMRAAGLARRVVAIGNELARCIDSQTVGVPLNANSIYELLDLSEDFSKQLREAQLDYTQCAPFALEVAWRIPDLAHRLAEPEHNWLHWLPQKGSLNATCLNASDWIANCMHPFGGSLLMSATIHPIDVFRKQCGLQTENTTIAVGHAPWREFAYEVAIDCRVDTRYSKREHYFQTTAQTIAALIESSPGVPVAVFFSSYQYAQNILNYLEVLAPSARAMLQPRGVDLHAQETFIDESLLLADALFLILGSSFAEGVDKLGGRIEVAMVVGPALPEVNLIQKAKLDAHPSLSREESFRDVYILPAMQRIHQALGRIVRAPEQRARVLLHGKRFADNAYSSALAPEYQNSTEIRTDGELLDWLSQHSNV